MERRDIQSAIRDRIEIIAPDTLVIAEEFSEWSGSLRRIDLLGISRDGGLVVIELKRNDTGEHMELQALRYAAMVSTLTFRRAVEVYSNYLRKRGIEKEAETEILSFLGWDEPQETSFAQDVRIILAAADFSRELTTTVMWLNERDLDIRCVRLIPYLYDGKILLDVQQVIPLPEAENYQIKIREQSEERRDSQKGARRYAEREAFWTELLTLARKSSTLHSNISPSRDTWIQAGAGKSGLAFVYRIRMHTCEVGLAIERRQPDENKLIFDQLYAAKDSIEQTLGSELEWDREDDRGSYHIRAGSDLGGYRDIERRAEIQQWMVAHMEKLERTLRPYINQIQI